MMKYIPIIFILLFFAVPGCLESSFYKEVSSSDLITNMSAFEGKKVCTDGIYDNHSISGIKIGRVQNFTDDSKDGIFVNVCGIYKDGKIEINSINSTMSIIAEQDVYHLNDTLRLHIDFISPDSGMGKVHVSGLKNPFDRLHINETREVIIKKGDNRFDFEFNLPSCEECTYLSPVMYMVNATVDIGGKTFESYKKIMLERNE